VRNFWKIILIIKYRNRRINEIRSIKYNPTPVGGNWLRISLLQWALIGALEGRMAEAALLVGFVEAGFLRNRETMDVTEMYVYNRVRELLFGRLSAAEIQNYANESAAWTDGEAAGFAMSRLIST
jgi:hypothetical protein